MRETEEIERFWLSLATTLSILDGEPSKFDQAGFVGMQLQVELTETIPQVLMELLGIRAVFETHHNVVRETHDDNVTAGVSLPPLSGPQIEYVVQVRICKERRNAPTLRCPRLEIGV